MLYLVTLTERHPYFFAVSGFSTSKEMFWILNFFFNTLEHSMINFSNVLYLENGVPVKIGYKILDNGSKVRYSKKTNNILD